MARRPLTQDQEAQLQGPILNAIDEYFDAAYTPGVGVGSVGTGGRSKHKELILVYIAFRVPEEVLPQVQGFLQAQAKMFAKIVVEDVPDVGK